MSELSDPIAPVLARMQAIATELPTSDGVARFNHLYLEVTEAVDGAAQTAGFADVDFLEALDVEFAGLYFKAFDASQAGQALPRCWAPLFDARADTRISPIQFALAGMNAHINHDLPFALVSTCVADGISPSRNSPEYSDFVKVNGLLSQVEARVKAEYLTGLIGVADEVVGRIDNVVAMWSIEEARNAAWTHAEMLWAVRDVPALADAFEDALDGTVGFASRGLLVPTLV
jgi:Family of unknown function (DUF5995)